MSDGGLVLTVAWLLVSAAVDGGASGFEQRTRDAMSTVVTVTLPESLPEAARAAAFAEAFAVFDDIDQQLNEWRPDSGLGRVNAGAGGPGVEAPQVVCEVVERSIDGARRTDGLFDPTWASLRGLWRFDGADEVPSMESVRAACARVGWRRVEVRWLTPMTATRACRITLPDKAQLGLGGFVKGWGVDRVVRLLRARGVHDFMVQAGGDLWVEGRRGAAPWRVGVRNPRVERAQPIATLDASGQAVSTSGDDEHFFIKGGVRYHHLIDPRTCMPAQASASVTVLAASATDAELLTKAGFILGPQAGLALMADAGAEAVWVTPDGGVATTPGLRGRVRMVAP